MSLPEVIFMGFIGFMALLAIGKRLFEKHSADRGYCDLHKANH